MKCYICNSHLKTDGNIMKEGTHIHGLLVCDACKDAVFDFINRLRRERQDSADKRICLNQHKLQKKDGLTHCKFCGESL